MSSTIDDPEQVAHEQALAAGSAEALEAEASDEEEAEEEYAAPGRRFLLFAAVPSWAISMIVHIIAIMILAFITFSPAVDKVANILNVANASEVEEVEEFEVLDRLEPLEVSEISDAQPVVQSTVDTTSEVVEVEVSTDVDAAAIQVDLVDFSTETAPRNDLMKEIGSMTGSALEGRSAKARGQLVRTTGGSEGSEKAVALALKWLAAHQLPDGSWSFEIGPCTCTHRGSVKGCFTGATAMALLPFLGSGQTHMEGEYKNTVGRGLAYLVRTEQPNGSLIQGGGSMYSHGLASIALCEAYAMTHDRQLMAPAQASIAFISYAQDPVGGGWRYSPRTPGDTSVVGWQLMALKSGHMAYLQVPPNTIQGAIKFLNTVQSDSGAKYGYAEPGAGPSTTAIGLLCRMYLGWKKDEPALQRGAEFISNRGPSPNDMYFNYYATQIMHHFGDEYWQKWNNVMRDQLVNGQVTTGHMTGSWEVPGGGHANDAGGRLYVTSMATMILEVYYRHMPIYAKEAAEEDFPL
ncbi:MAG: terpene cyclase/mutase family protein [Planctomycetota bacterium]|nr:terpene cyclase/mutase family protein [Planctomycetota bacterium]